MRILLADDEALLRITLRDDLEEAGHAVTLVSDGDKALAQLADHRFDCVVTDLRMPGADGLQVIRAAKKSGADAVAITGHGSIGLAVEAMRDGAYDFLEKPFLGEALVKVLDRIGEKRSGKSATGIWRGEDGPERNKRGFAQVVGGVSESFAKILGIARQAAITDATLLIVGESGSGKEVIAKAIHEESARWRKPFVAVSCGALSPALLDDELFGHEKGAFTDAKNERAGRFEEAEGGTLFLDDIDDMRLDTQVKLLRVLQEREFRRIGGMESRRVDIRVIAASKTDLGALAAEGRFRADLYYRLHVLRIDLPPLRERRGDIPDLVRSFVAKHNQGPLPHIGADAMSEIVSYDWPGNVRQLENAVCRALALRGGAEELSARDLLPPGAETGGDGDLSLASAVKRAERAHIGKVLSIHGGNRSQTAAALGISRKNLWEKMRQLGIGD
ncbi:MAG: sigma-54 dependent transcriptional regulator [Planctomycetota bacterium]|jgi:two-component system C4-dicarboxylate transport response regulator DctD|nr:sigma-54 dependent transcriptional regulator [Planctomycetota bacterium]